MLRAPLVSALILAMAGGLAPAAPVRAQETNAPGALGEVPLPGGVDRALAVLKDRVAADRSQFLLEFIRRTYHSPMGPISDAREPRVRALVDHLESAAAAGSTADTLPLPLPAELWTDVIFPGSGQRDQGVVRGDRIAIQIVRSRNASLLYSGLLELDDQTRAWMAGQRDLLREIAAQHAAAFVVAASGIRVSGGAMRLPGGARAAAAWQEVVGRRANEPAAFIRAVLSRSQGRLAYFLGSMAQLTPEQVALAFSLDADDPSAHAAAAQRLYRVHERLAPEWRVENRAFWRPQFDPALLVADLGTGEHGRPLLPGSRAFWTVAFADGRIGAARTDAGAAAAAEGSPAEFAWICEQVFDGDHSNEQRRYQRVLFASRVLRRIQPAGVADSVDAVRGAAAFPALSATLERAGIVDVATFAAAARAAGRLSGIGDEPRAARALSQFQGALALISRAALRGSVPPRSLPGLVASLAAVETGERGDYEGRLVSWLEACLRELSPREEDRPPTATASADEMLDRSPGPVERRLLALLAGRLAKPPQFVEWEGMRYRLDFAWAEAARLTRVLGEHTPPYLSSAVSLIAVAGALEQQTLTRDIVRTQLDVLTRIAGDVALDDAEGWMGTGVPRRFRDVVEPLRRATEGRGADSALRMAPAIRLLADDLLARGLRTIAYADAFGTPDRTSASAGDAAARHDFGFRTVRGSGMGPWHLPTTRAGDIQGWRLVGSLLGLPVRLAEFSLVPLSAKPPPRPTLNGEDRRVFVETVALIEPSALTDRDRDTIVRAMQRGRIRLASLRTAADAHAVADEIRLAPTRRSLMPWVLAHDSPRAAGFLSPSELLWLGLEGLPVDVRLNVWGAPAEPRLGCLCLQLLDRRPWESFAGRWNTGMLASGFPDLNLRLSELLAEMRMPAPLLAPVLTSAMLDFVNSATSRDQDDRRGLVEFVQRLGSDRVEQYLALLTTDGPLVPSEETGTPGSGGNWAFRSEMRP